MIMFEDTSKKKKKKIRFLRELQMRLIIYNQKLPMYYIIVTPLYTYRDKWASI